MKNLLITIFGVSFMVLMPLTLIDMLFETPPEYVFVIFAMWIGTMTVLAIVWTTKVGFFDEWEPKKVAQPRYRSPGTNEWKWESKTTYSAPVTKEEAEILDRIKKRVDESVEKTSKEK